MTQEETAGDGAGHPMCYRHPGRETYIRCQRCDRHICPDCQRTASVGVHCVECVQEGAKTMRQARTRFGGIPRADGSVVTKVLIGLNLAVFIAALMLPTLFWHLGLIGGPICFDALCTGGEAGVSQGEYWRLLTSVFLHTAPVHFGVNMLALWILGPPLESSLGRLRFTALYLLSGFGGSALAYAFTAPNRVVLGASGAIAGLFGATIVLARQLRWNVRFLLVILGLNVVLNVVLSQALSWQGHLGGLIAGAGIGLAFAYAPHERRTLVHLIAFGLVAAGVIALTVWRTGVLTGAF